MPTCSYCGYDVDSVTEYTSGSYCNECVSSIQESLGDPAFYSNKFFCCFWNKDHIRIGFGFAFDGWFELDLGFISIKSNHA